VPSSLNIHAPAKINLVLEVLGKREDGYHDIDTVLQTISLTDVVRLEFGTSTGVEVMAGDFAAGTPAGETNLAWKAAVELARRCGRDVSALQIRLVKQIPAAAGLGGGASDAASTLRLLQEAWPEVTERDLLESAAAVGSDVPFFLMGGTARATGRGERVEPLPDIAEHGVVLFVPPTTMEQKTARLFAALDELPFDDGSVAASFVATPPAQIRGADIYNAFERVAFDVFPRLAALWEDLETRIGEPIRLAGAGPTLFWIGPLGEVRSVAARAESLPCTVIETRTSPSLWSR
jgi:4-diphosphocytidyl-2-C-methyl-D-erythritol kinase